MSHFRANRSVGIHYWFMKSDLRSTELKFGARKVPSNPDNQPMETRIVHYIIDQCKGALVNMRFSDPFCPVVTFGGDLAGSKLHPSASQITFYEPIVNASRAICRKMTQTVGTSTENP